MGLWNPFARKHDVNPCLGEVSPIREILLRHPRDAFVSQSLLNQTWRALNYLAEPDFVRACAEYDGFVRVLESQGMEIHFLAGHPRLTPDALYVRDAAILTPRGLCLAAMGKVERVPETDVLAEQSKTINWSLCGGISPPGQVEGGDLVWLDSKRVLIAHGYRTNAEGIRQFQDLVGSEVEVREVPLPHFRGPNDVLHLMSMISPVDHDLALVYSPLMPVPFRNWLLELGMTLVEVPESEYDSLGCNVLALAPRRCVLVEGNPETRRALERAGAEVIEIEGSEICLKGSGGPTCLTRPLVRSPF